MRAIGRRLANTQRAEGCQSASRRRYWTFAPPPKGPKSSGLSFSGSPATMGGEVGNLNALGSGDVIFAATPSYAARIGLRPERGNCAAWSVSVRTAATMKALCCKSRALIAPTDAAPIAAAAATRTRNRTSASQARDANPDDTRPP